MFLVHHKGLNPPTPFHVCDLWRAWLFRCATKTLQICCLCRNSAVFGPPRTLDISRGFQISKSGTLSLLQLVTEPGYYAIRAPRPPNCYSPFWNSRSGNASIYSTLIQSQAPSPLVQTDLPVLVGVTQVQERRQAVLHWFDGGHHEEELSTGHKSVTGRASTVAITWVDWILFLQYDIPVLWMNVKVTEFPDDCVHVILVNFGFFQHPQVLCIKLISSGLKIYKHR